MMKDINEETKIIDTLDVVKELSENLNEKTSKKAKGIPGPVVFLGFLLGILPGVFMVMANAKKKKKVQSSHAEEQPIDEKANEQFASKAKKIAALNKKLGVHLFLDTGLVAVKKQKIHESMVTLAFIGKSINALEKKLQAEKISYNVMSADGHESVIRFTYQSFEFEIIVLHEENGILETTFSLPIEGKLKLVTIKMPKYKTVNVKINKEELKTWDVKSIEAEMGTELVNIKQYYDFLAEKKMLTISPLETLSVSQVKVS